MKGLRFTVQCSGILGSASVKKQLSYGCGRKTDIPETITDTVLVAGTTSAKWGRIPIDEQGIADSRDRRTLPPDVSQ